MLVVFADPDVSAPRSREAKAFADQNGLDWAEERESAGPLALCFAKDRIELHARAPEGEVAHKGWLRPLYVDFEKLDVRSPAGRRFKQPLAKALGLHKHPGPLHVLDATAGLGEDSCLLASFGCEVRAIERSPVLSLMLRDGCERARSQMPDLISRITLLEADAVDYMREGPESPVDVVYLDPMFPARGRAARERKSMRMLRALVGDDSDVHELFEAARALALQRVVVKRPSRAEPLGIGPHISQSGRAMRYDIYFPGSPGR